MFVTMESNQIYIKKLFPPNKTSLNSHCVYLMSCMLCIRAERLFMYKHTKQEGFLSQKVYTIEKHWFWKGKQREVKATTSLEQ